MTLEPDDIQDEIAQNENVVDIFVLCSHPDDIRELAEHLNSRGYRLTQFLDQESLLESLRAGKPNLLIIDSASAGPESCAFCRELKADSDMWRVPVLVITGITDLGDLLSVLDSNADNFIARPYDPQYLVSLVDSMLISAVEKPDPEKIKTQFKIRHDDTDYVITADRRKLLEFLLSSFEIAMSRSGDLQHSEEELSALRSTMERQIADRTRELSTEVTHLETLIRERSREIETLNARVSEHVNGSEDLNRQIEEREKVISDQKESIDRIKEDLESTRSHLAETEDSLRTLQAERDEIGHSLQGDIEKTKEELRVTREDLDASNIRYEKESEKRAELEEKVTHLVSEVESFNAEKNARAIETEQLKSALSAEKARAASAEQEVKSILQEKDQSEQDLRQMIEDITKKANVQAEDAQKLSGELAQEKQLRQEAEKVHEDLRVETARKESALSTEKESLRGHADELQKKIDVLTESFGAQGQRCTSLESEIAKLTSRNGDLEAEIKSLNDRVDTAAASYEDEKRHHLCTQKNLRELTEAKELEKQEFESVIDELRKDLDQIKADLVRAYQEKDALAVARKEIEEQLSAAQIACAQSEKLARSAASELELATDELVSERRKNRSSEENLLTLTHEKDALSQDLAKRDERILALTEESESHREAHGSLEERIAVLTRDLEDARAGTASLLAEKESLQQITGESVQKLTSDLEAVRAEASSGKGELDRIRAELESRTNEFAALSDEKDRAIRERDAKIQALTEESESHREAHGSLEERIAGLTKNLEDSEAKSASLLAEKESQQQTANESIHKITADLETVRAQVSFKADELSRVRAELESRTNEFAALKDEKDRAIRERDVKIQALTEESESHREAHGSLEEQIAALTKNLEDSEAKSASLLAEKESQQQTANESIHKITADLETVRAQVSFEADELSRVRAELESRTNEFAALKNEKDRAIRERDVKIQALTEESESHREAHGSLEERIVWLTRDLEEAEVKAAAARSEKDSLQQKSDETLRLITAELEKERADGSAHVEDIEALRREKILAEQKISVLENQIARIPLLETDLAAERGAVAARENGYEDRIRTLNERFLTEQTARETAERALADSRSRVAGLTDKVTALEVTSTPQTGEELSTATKRMQSLEVQLLDTERELAQKDAVLQELSSQNEQVLEELSEERELHRKTREDLNEANQVLAAGKRPVNPEVPVREYETHDHAIIRKTPELPAVVRHESYELMVPQPVTDPAKQTATPIEKVLPELQPEPGIQIRSLEDLFEDRKAAPIQSEMAEDKNAEGYNPGDSLYSPPGFSEPLIPVMEEPAPEPKTRDLPEDPVFPRQNSDMDGNAGATDDVSPEYGETPKSEDEDNEPERSAPVDETPSPAPENSVSQVAEKIRQDYTGTPEEEVIEPENAGETYEEAAVPDDEETHSGPVLGPVGSDDRSQGYELVKWAHQAQGLTKEQRIRVFKFGRLIQKGKKLTGRQEKEVSEILALAHTMGYRSGK
ncbi:MAG: response regulator [Methanoregula sp.]